MVDLPGGRKLFVLFTRTPQGSGPSSWLAYSYAVKSELGNGQTPQKSEDRDLDGDGYSDLPTYSPMPYLVTFRNLRDPTTISQVDPRNLAASFGQGYRLRRIALKPLQGDPFEWAPGMSGPRPGERPSRLKTALPWLISFRTDATVLRDGSSPFPNDIARYSFVQE